MDLSEILNNLNNWWGQICVWLPVWLTANSLLILQICKAILNIINSKKVKAEMHKDMKIMQEKRSKDRHVIKLLFLANLKMMHCFNQILNSIFNEEVKTSVEKCLLDTKEIMSKAKETFEDSNDDELPDVEQDNTFEDVVETVLREDSTDYGTF